jgi:3-methylfumaryl-CoA hydratase
VVEHQIRQLGRVVVDEQQDIVYREASPSPGRLPAASEACTAVRPADGEWVIEVSPALLFRFSALTYNAHRIHYDRDYARRVEGYPGLLVHGPLQALVMAEAARATERNSGQRDGRLYFEYRLISPLFDYQGMVVSAARQEGAMMTAVRDNHGSQTATGILRRSATEREKDC